MNKTITMNLSGMVFNIDEAAYQCLNVYIEQIRRIFSTYTDGNEIVQDIEARIAEKFKISLDAQQKQVVELSDFEQIQKEIGNAHDFEQEIATDNADTNNQPQATPRTHKPQRLYRDKDNRKLAGVAAGVAAYLGVDVALVRIVWLVSIFAGGLSIVLYFVIWASTNYANTIVQRTEMQGATPNLTNIFTIRQQHNAAGAPVRSAYIADALERVIQLAFNAIKIVVGVLALLKGSALMLCGILLVGVGGVGYWRIGRLNGVPLRNFTGGLASDFGAQTLTAILIIVPSLLLIYVGLRLLFSRRIFNKNTVRILLFGWVGTLVLATVFVVATLGNFVERGRYQVIQNIALPDTAQTVQLSHIDDYGGNEYTNFDIQLHTHNDPNIIIKKTFAAQGSDAADAIKNAKMVQYKTELLGNVLTFDNKLVFDNTAIFRVQRADIDVFLPKNGIFMLNNQMRYQCRNEAIGDYLLANNGDNDDEYYDDERHNGRTKDGYNFKNKQYKLINDTIKCVNCDDLLDPKYWEIANNDSTENARRLANIKLFLGK